MPRIIKGVKQATRELRDVLDRLTDQLSEAHDRLSELEEAAGLARDDGSRVDDPPRDKPTSREVHDLSTPVTPGGVGKVTRPTKR